MVAEFQRECYHVSTVPVKEYLEVIEGEEDSFGTENPHPRKPRVEHPNSFYHIKGRPYFIGMRDPAFRPVPLWESRPSCPLTNTFPGPIKVLRARRVLGPKRGLCFTIDCLFSWADVFSRLQPL